MTRQPRISLHLPIAVLMAAAAGASADPTLTRSVIACGGCQSAGGTYTLTGTIGQPLAGGALSSGSVSLSSGFWAPSGCPADADGNGQIQPADVATFVSIWFSSVQ